MTLKYYYWNLNKLRVCNCSLKKVFPRQWYFPLRLIYYTITHFLLPAKLWEGRSNVFIGICLFMGGGGGWGDKCITSDLGPTPPPGHQTLGPTPCFLYLVGITGDLLKLFHLRTYPTPTSTDIKWWPLKYLQLASGRYASYWNAIFCSKLLNFFKNKKGSLAKKMNHVISLQPIGDWLALKSAHQIGLQSLSYDRSE